MDVSRSCAMVRLKLMTLAYVKPMSLATLPPMNSRAQRAVRRRTSERASTAISFLGQGTGMEYRSKNYSVVQSLEGKWKWSNRLRRPQQKGQGAQPTCRSQGSRARD